MTNDSQEQQKKKPPFQIALIDIKIAAKKNEIHCIKKTLEGTEDLEFVALSYRWGDLNESMVDTKLDYIATIVSFGLDDFCMLCKIMTEEIHLQHMKYVWVDAICVDQTNKERQKETIHQMTNIYKRANYILAVPDLHLAYLRRVTFSNHQNIQNANTFGNAIFHLLHGTLPSNDDDPIWKVDSSPDMIENSMRFLLDLVMDWSSRVWVISEYSIAKDKNEQKMKYWFIQLGSHYERNRYNHMIRDTCAGYSFFEFDFFRHNGLPHHRIQHHPRDTPLVRQLKTKAQQMYIQFHSKMAEKLNEQTFLEIVLKSRATKNADRFHAVLPESKYSHIHKNKDVIDAWGITNLTSVKLKLYEFMDTEDKLELLFLSAGEKSLRFAPDILPTFATSNIYWSSSTGHRYTVKDGGTFDLQRPDTIQLIKIMEKDVLLLKPRQYFKHTGLDMRTRLTDELKKTNQPQFKQLLSINDHLLLDVVRINRVYYETSYDLESKFMQGDRAFILLIGSFKTNRWLLRTPDPYYPDVKQHTLVEPHVNDPAFHIY